MSHIDYVAGDRTKLIRTCKDKDNDNAVIDLTGATVLLKYSIDGATLVTKTMTIQAPATAGKVEYEFTANDLTAGEMKGAVEVTDSASKVFTQLDPFTRTIRAKL